MINFKELTRAHLIKIYKAHVDYSKKNVWNIDKWIYHNNVIESVKNEFQRRYGHMNVA